MAELQLWSREAIDAVMRLSPREYQVLRALAAGKSGPEIAAEMHVAYPTAKTFLARLYGKLGARNAANAVDVAYRAGVLRVEVGGGDRDSS